MSSNAPKQLATPEETFQTSAVHFNFATRFGWGFPSGTAAQEKIASMVTIGTRTQSWRTWWCLGKSMDLIPFPWSHPCARTCFQMSRSGPGVLGGGPADSFDGFLRSICFSCALLVVYSAFQLIWWALRISVFSLSVSLFPLELWWRPMLLSSWPRLKRRFRPQYFNSTFPLVLDEDSRWGLLHRRRSLLWWQRERGPSRDGHGDAWARAWISSPFREAPRGGWALSPGVGDPEAPPTFWGSRPRG